MRVDVRLFGGLAERAGSSHVAVELPESATVADLRRAVATAYPTLGPLVDRSGVAVDLEVRADDHPVPVDAEVALLPPVAGGSDAVDDHRERLDAAAGGDDRARAPDAAAGADDPEGGVRRLTGLREPPLDVAGALAAIAHPAAGGTALFLGTVRDHASDLDGVVRLDYSAYPAMAERVLARLASEVVADHPEIRGIALLHAVGDLEVGAHTVLVACAAPHRDQAFVACRDALERVKDQTPVWKREVTADGAHRWVGLPGATTGPPGGDR
jgi:molybdopterin synthase catalytic subunit